MAAPLIGSSKSIVTSHPGDHKAAGKIATKSCFTGVASRMAVQLHTPTPRSTAFKMPKPTGPVLTSAGTALSPFVAKPTAAGAAAAACTACSGAAAPDTVFSNQDCLDIMYTVGKAVEILKANKPEEAVHFPLSEALEQLKNVLIQGPFDLPHAAWTQKAFNKFRNECKIPQIFLAFEKIIKQHALLKGWRIPILIEDPQSICQLPPPDPSFGRGSLREGIYLDCLPEIISAIEQLTPEERKKWSWQHLPEALKAINEALKTLIGEVFSGLEVLRHLKTLKFRFKIKAFKALRTVLEGRQLITISKTNHDDSKITDK